MEATETSTQSTAKLKTLGLIAAVVGAFIFGAGAVMAGEGHPEISFWRAYIFGWSMWSGVAIAALGILMMHFMVGGGWGYISRRILEAGAMAIPIFGLLFLPVMFLGLGTLYEWSHVEWAKNDPIVSNKLWWLNTPFFLGRMVFYFVLFSSYAVVLNKLSAEMDKNPSWERVKRVKAISSVGMLVYVLVITFYYVDTIMSLTPHWYSTIYGILQMVGQALAMFSICAILLSKWEDKAPFAGVLNKQHFWDIGNLMLAFTMLWTYMAFSQFLISWSGNLPEEAMWYIPRNNGVWYVVSGAIMLFHFAVPFMLLLQRPIKKKGPALALVGMLVIFMRHVDLLWILQPSFEAHDAAQGHHSSPLIYVAYLGSTVAFGGIFFFLLAFFAAKKPLLPLFKSHVEPKIVAETEAIHHG